MNRLSAAARFLSLALVLFSAPVTAGERVRLGYGRLVANDTFGDGNDRWRSGSLASSRVRGLRWDGHLPERAGEIIEYRLLAEVRAPANLVVPGVGDRPYAGALSLGAHTHFQQAGFEIAAGADLVVTGPQTGLDRLQTVFHDIMGVPGPSAATRAGQIGNGFHPTLVVEAGRAFELGRAVQLRPFVEGRLGAETLLRAGVDLTVGRIGGAGEMLVRDPVTGHRYRTIQDDGLAGLSFVLGADVARVEDSIFLPAPAYRLSESRNRLRAGLHWQGKSGQSGFYGLSWLGEEFVGQREGQVVGAVRLNFNF